jgi:hypothetical protein
MRWPSSPDHSSDASKTPSPAATCVPSMASEHHQQRLTTDGTYPHMPR